MSRLDADLNRVPPAVNVVKAAPKASLAEQARAIRLDIVRMAYEAGPERRGHPGPALSVVDIMVTLFFHTMRIDPASPKWADRDRFILSKGHASLALYATLARLNYFPREELRSFRRAGGMLQGHPDMKGIPGVDMTTGSLGHGLSAGVGMALAARMDRRPHRVFVVLGDGECQEGLVWEAAMAAAHFALDNLVAVIDCNGWQSCDAVSSTISLEPFRDKWASFGWNVIEIDGHDFDQIDAAMTLAAAHKGGPTAVIARTIKGKGVSFMENDNSWHQKALTTQEYEQAVAELSGGGVR